MTRPTLSHTSNEKTLLADPQLVMDLRGDWQNGGLLEVFIPGLPEPVSIELATGPWAVLAQLFLSAIRAKHWTDARMSSAELGDVLEGFEVIQLGTPEAIHKLVSTLRNNLAEPNIQLTTDDSHLSPMQWAKLLIHNTKGKGYRITTPPKNLTLFIGDIEHNTDTVE